MLVTACFNDVYNCLVLAADVRRLMRKRFLTSFANQHGFKGDTAESKADTKLSKSSYLMIMLK